ncbi:MAG: hypothetical protein MJZ28_11485 [Paludibacteraceae bacterium]|nr:hypothetical protein [Paludibacteraceae bacterium]
MENQVEKSTRGGKREGAGRKKTTSKRYGFNAPKEIEMILEGVSDKTAYIIQAIQEKFDREKG